ncbi:restriction endonuclease subunit S [Acinetobacter baumannii]|uniref:restriction endonuclease subunit S n=1 Tax=Acinetobacter baumannii TaxID=470 RepID=UPI00254EA33C|nr:restriction endonuclease subunit S [Acinetobacter baumannii]MDK6140218.1 restriction endonuclease subunit S [Acinetobacter baumannii]
MAKYQKYAEYKDSGVDWLEVIPSHWTSIAIKFLALDKNSLFLDGDWIESKDISDSGIRYITTGNVGTGFYKEQGSGFITESTFKKLSCSEVYAGDILISRLNLPIGRACIVPDLKNRIVTSVDNVIFRPDEEYHPKFLVYLFSSKEYFQNTENIARGATMQRISRGLLGNIRVVMPSKDEQTQIANFLDHETAKIDHLIEKQQQLIELLKEKRQAVISHAVTKGLDPNVPMKDSGVEWLGEVPEHWNVTCLARISGIKRGSGYQNIEMEVEGQDTIQMLRIADMHEIAPALIVKNTEVIRYLVEEGDILVAGTGATAGISMLVPKECNGWVHSYNSIKVKVDSKKVNSAFLQLFLISDYIKKSLDVSFVGSAQPFVDTNGLGRLRVLLPPLHEQINIYDYLNIKTRKIDLLISKAQSAIQLMQERRTALISATVTGKIDVRNWQSPTVAETHTELSA